MKIKLKSHCAKFAFGFVLFLSVLSAFGGIAYSAENAIDGKIISKSADGLVVETERGDQYAFNLLPADGTEDLDEIWEIFSSVTKGQSVRVFYEKKNGRLIVVGIEVLEYEDSYKKFSPEYQLVLKAIERWMFVIEKGEKRPSDVVPHLVELGKPAVPILREYLASRVLTKRVVAAFALVQIGDPSVLKDFIKIVRAELLPQKVQEDYDMRSYAAMVLADRNRTPNIKLTEIALKKYYNKIVRILHQEAVSFPNLILQLKHNDEKVRMFAFRRLENIAPAEKGKGVEPGGTINWEKCYVEWRDWWQSHCKHYRVDVGFRVMIIELLGQLRVKAAVPNLIGMLEDHIEFKAAEKRSDRADIAQAEDLALIIRLAVISALAKIPDSRRMTPIIEALNDRAYPIRKAAIKFLIDERIISERKKILAIALDKSNSVDVRIAALHYVGDLGDEKSSSALIPMLDEPDSTVRSYAVKTLGKLRCADAVPHLVGMVLSYCGNNNVAAKNQHKRPVSIPMVLYALMEILRTPEKIRQIQKYDDICKVLKPLALTPVLAGMLLPSDNKEDVRAAACYLARTTRRFLRVVDVQTPEEYAEQVVKMEKEEREKLADFWEDWWRNNKARIPIDYNLPVAVFEFAGAFRLKECKAMIDMARASRLASPEVTAAAIFATALFSDNVEEVAALAEDALRAGHAVVRLAGMRMARRLHNPRFAQLAMERISDVNEDAAVLVEAIKYVEQERITSALKSVLGLLAHTDESVSFGAALCLARLTGHYYGERLLKDPEVYAARVRDRDRSSRIKIQSEWKRHFKIRGN